MKHEQEKIPATQESAASQVAEGAQKKFIMKPYDLEEGNAMNNNAFKKNFHFISIDHH